MKFVTLFLTAIFLLPACAAPAGPKWFQTRRAAMAEVKKTGRPLLIDVNAKWCGPCEVMNREVFQGKKFAAEAKRWVLLSLDVDAHPELAAFYGVRSFPTLVVLNPRGKVVASAAGYSGAAATLKFIANSWAKAKK